ncbi:PTS sugar transporter subunit IIA domain-containing protein [Phytohabitans kaempferiae]|uniref:PTS EIIA type-4 domain-containing protein n=1 Tax=Phytohabitans kaempferiae TaxID=1620943 RepID=A0ABV6M2H9_9ACTN
MGGRSLTVEVAGGTEEGGIGTSYDLVRAAIERADAGAGVVVLPDLGNSVLTTRAVLDDHPGPAVTIVDAPPARPSRCAPPVRPRPRRWTPWRPCRARRSRVLRAPRDSSGGTSDAPGGGDVGVGRAVLSCR